MELPATAAAQAQVDPAQVDRRKAIDASALARNKERQPLRLPDDAKVTDPQRAIETARRTVINRAAKRSQGNRVQDGQTLATLQATGGAPAGQKSTSSLLATRDEEKSRTSLFDLPSSGGAVIDRMRAQVRPSSPLNGLLGGEDGPGALSSFIGIDKSDPLSGLGRTPMSLSAAQSLAAGLRSSFTRIGNSSRSLMQMNNPLRSSGGFGLQLPTSSFSVLG